MENAAENPSSDEEDIVDEIRKLKEKLQEAIRKKEARKRRKQKIAIRNELLRQIAEVEADDSDTDIADSKISLQVPSTTSHVQLGSPGQYVPQSPGPQLEAVPPTEQVPVQRTIPQPQVTLMRGEHNESIRTHAESLAVPSDVQPGTVATVQSSQLRQPTATVVRTTEVPWTQVIQLETSGNTI